MNTFRMILEDGTKQESVENVASFVGEDGTGKFGILAGHARLMTSLVFGLARFRIEDKLWHYLAVPGALLYFSNNTLSISSRRFLLDDDYQRIGNALHEQLLREEEDLRKIKNSLHRMEDEILRRMWEIRRK